MPSMRRMYPWEKWLDGREHRLRADRDFVVSIATMQTIIHIAARRRKQRVQTKAWNGVLFVQAVRP